MLLTADCNLQPASIHLPTVRYSPERRPSINSNTQRIPLGDRDGLISSHSSDGGEATREATEAPRWPVGASYFPPPLLNRAPGSCPSATESSCLPPNSLSCLRLMTFTRSSALRNGEVANYRDSSDALACLPPIPSLILSDGCLPSPRHSPSPSHSPSPFASGP